jgi:O-antigen/teichoic acid export membrane protein
MIPALRLWLQDRSLRGILKNSGYLFSSSAVNAVLTAVQGILVARLLGMDGLGVVTIAITYASSVNRLVSFRMSEVVVRYLGKNLAQEKREEAGALVKGAYLTEAAISIFAFLLLWGLAPIAAKFFYKQPGDSPYLVFYGLVLLANLVFESSTGVLQATGRFDRISLVNVAGSMVTFVLIAAAFIANWGILPVLAAYLAGKAVASAALTLMALRQLNISLGPGWLRAPLHSETRWREMFRFAVSTNLNGTVNLIVRDSEPLLISALRNETEVGYFKIAMGLVNLVTLPVEPLIWPTYAEITRSIAQRQWSATRRLLKRISLISAAWTVPAAGLLILFGRWLVPFLYKPDAAPAYPALALLLVGYGFANILQWNRPLLLALGRPGYPLKVSAVFGVVKTVLTFALLPALGYIAEAGIVSAYLIASIGMTAWRGIAEISHNEKATPPQEPLFKQVEL